jgi:centromere protein I
VISLWKGPAYPKTYLGLLSSLSIRPFQEFRDTYIQTAHNNLAGHQDAPTLILEFYTSLAQNWANILLTSAESATNPASRDLRSFTDLIEHVDYYILTLLISNPADPPALTPVLNYYITLSHINSATTTSARLPVLFPPPTVVNAILNHASLPTLSGLCSLLAAHKRVLETRTRVANPSHPIPQLHLQLFNTHLMDTCNLLWRSRGLVADTSNPVTANVSGAGCPPSVRQTLQSHLAAVDKLYGAAVAFDLSHHPALAFAAPVVMDRQQDEYFASQGISGREAPRQLGPVTTMSLKALEEEGGAVVFWKEFRVGVLEWLAERGAGGIKELMFGTMKDLMRPA